MGSQLTATPVLSFFLYDAEQAASTVDGCMSFFLLSQKTGAPLMGPCPAAIHPQGGGKSAQEEALGLLIWHQSGLIIAASETGAVTAWKVTGRAVADLLLNNLEQQADKGPMMPVEQVRRAANRASLWLPFCAPPSFFVYLVLNFLNQSGFCLLIFFLREKMKMDSTWSRKLSMRKKIR